MIINRHGDFDPQEIYRLLKPGGIFIAQQVGEDNNRELVKMVLGDIPKPFPGMNLKDRVNRFVNAGFNIITQDEAFPKIRFYDLGAFVWFASIVEWEFVGFSVDKCFNELVKMQEIIDTDGYIEGTTHCYLIVARK